MDVWMKRAMRQLFLNGREPKRGEIEDIVAAWGQDAGIIQQYIFHFARETALSLNDEATAS